VEGLFGRAARVVAACDEHGVRAGALELERSGVDVADVARAGDENAVRVEHAVIGVAARETPRVEIVRIAGCPGEAVDVRRARGIETPGYRRAARERRRLRDVDQAERIRAREIV